MIAILSLHILIALSGIVTSFWAFFKPSAILIRLSYIFVSFTIASGAYMVIAGYGQLTASCITGLVYLAVVALGLVPARRRLGLIRSV